MTQLTCFSCVWQPSIVLPLKYEAGVCGYTQAQETHVYIYMDTPQQAAGDSLERNIVDTELVDSEGTQTDLSTV